MTASKNADGHTFKELYDAEIKLAPREMMDACPDCIYALRAGVKYGASTPVYRCRRFPPTLLPRYSGAENQFPVVSEKNWCGEFHDSIKAAP
jgi:hypothetical protein|tara:strand:- start:4 stop:279 length:276 start_codon:yes stop_codon:yes gene_type:complete